MLELPDKQYKVIYCDPPWSYKDKAKAGNRGAEFKYSCMSLKELVDLDVNSIAEENCAMFMWTTGPMMPTALKLMSVWGFEYKTIAFTWVKRNKIADTWFWGMGNWTRANPEFCLLGIKGKPRRMSAKVHSIIESRIEGHSVKPWATRDNIELLMGPINRIELFARQQKKGWDSWGLEA